MLRARGAAGLACVREQLCPAVAVGQSEKARDVRGNRSGSTLLSPSSFGKAKA